MGIKTIWKLTFENAKYDCSLNWKMLWSIQTINNYWISTAIAVVPSTIYTLMSRVAPNEIMGQSSTRLDPFLILNLSLKCNYLMMQKPPYTNYRHTS